MAAQSSPSTSAVERIDRMAMVLSALCAVHCVVTPLLLALAPFVATHAFEEGMRALLGGLAVVGIGVGTYLHRSFRAVLPLGVGLSLLLYVTWVGEHGNAELWLSLVASACLVTAHVLNSRACRAVHRAVATS